MAQILRVAGGVLALVGLLGMVVGVPIKELSTGNLLIMAGVVALCAGLIVVALAAVLAELVRLRLTLDPAGTSARRTPPLARMTPPSVNAPAAMPSSMQPSMSSPSVAVGPARYEAAPAREPAPFADPHADLDDAAYHGEPGHDLPADLHDESSAAPAPSELYAPEEPAVAPHADAQAGEGGAEAAPPPWAKPKRREFFPLRPDLKKRAEKRAKPVNEPLAPQADFDSLWPARSSARGERASAPTAAEDFAGASFVEARESSPARESEPVPAGDDHHPVTVLKSGVIEGMAYSLFSDGSIEAELGDGTIHFNSLDDLRAHLDRRV